MLHLQPTLVGASKPKSASANARHRWVESNSFKLWPWGCILSNRIEWKIKAWKLCRGCREPLNELRPFTPYLSFTFLSRNLNDYNRHIIDVYIYIYTYIYIYIYVHKYTYIYIYISTWSRHMLRYVTMWCVYHCNTVCCICWLWEYISL